MDEAGEEHVCKAAGRFRYENIEPLPGDEVEYISESGQEYGFIEGICERSNALVRPPVANITQLVIALAVKNPMPDLLLVDKMLVQAAKKGIQAVLFINKTDIAGEEPAGRIADQYKGVCDTIMGSAVTGAGLDSLKALLKGRITCFAGQSAVGKSSVLNALIPSLHMKTGGTSRKTERGRHTTRHVELIFSDEIEGGVFDTPGFSMYEETEEPENLGLYYPDFAPYLGMCRFNSCVHANEPGCAVKEAVSQGKIHIERYERYLRLLQELKEKRANKYD
jgi:ribosome biogenesis GTPase